MDISNEILSDWFSLSLSLKDLENKLMDHLPATCTTFYAATAFNNFYILNSKIRRDLLALPMLITFLGPCGTLCLTCIE